MIYVIEAVNYDAVKIGYTAGVRSLVQRMQVLQVSHFADLKIMYVLPGGNVEERALHKAAKSWRIRGEWFTRHALCLFSHIVPPKMCNQCGTIIDTVSGGCSYCISVQR